MAIQSYFFNAVLNDGVYDRLYNAEDVTSYLDQIVGSGVFPNPSTNLQVSAAPDMTVIVAAGSGWIKGHKLINTAPLVLQVDASDVVLNRIDKVVMYVDFTERAMGIAIKKGTLAQTPHAPEIVRNNTRIEYALATIQVDKQITGIKDAMITDMRYSSECGVVTGLIRQVDTSTLWQQQQDAFNTWFDGVQDQFEAGKIFKKLEGIYTTQQDNEASFNVLTYVPSYSFAYDILEVFINGFHLNANEYTISNSTVTLETPISEAGAVVDFVVYKSVPEE